MVNTKLGEKALLSTKSSSGIGKSPCRQYYLWMAKGDDIHRRLLELAVSAVDVCERLPKTPLGRHIGDQLMRSGTSPSSNYEEARAAESRKDFAHKLGVVLKELRETLNWLEIIARRNMVSHDQVATLKKETDELCRIIAVSLRTLRKGKSFADDGKE